MRYSTLAIVERSPTHEQTEKVEKCFKNLPTGCSSCEQSCVSTVYFVWTVCQLFVPSCSNIMGPCSPRGPAVLGSPCPGGNPQPMGLVNCILFQADDSGYILSTFQEMLAESWSFCPEQNHDAHLM